MPPSLNDTRFLVNLFGKILMNRDDRINRCQFARPMIQVSSKDQSVHDRRSLRNYVKPKRFYATRCYFFYSDRPSNLLVLRST